MRIEQLDNADSMERFPKENNIEPQYSKLTNDLYNLYEILLSKKYEVNNDITYINNSNLNKYSFGFCSFSYNEIIMELMEKDLELYTSVQISLLQLKILLNYYFVFLLE